MKKIRRFASIPNDRALSSGRRNPERFGVLAAIAVVGLSQHSARAESSVQLYGVLDVGVGQYQASGAARTSQLNSGNMTVPFFGFKGSEDLGGGLAAVFALESYVLPDTGTSGRYTGDSFWSRQSNVGIANSYGSLIFGRMVAPMYLTTARFNPFGISFSFSPAIRNWWATGRVAGDTGWNNAIGVFSTPYAGLSGNLVRSFAEGANGGNLGANASYTLGGLSLGLGAQRVKVPFASGSENAWMAAASYDFGPAKAFGQFGKVHDGSTRLATAGQRVEISQWGVSVKAGLGFVLGSWSKADTSGPIPVSRTFVSIGYDYFLSKRTDLYLLAMRDKMAGKSSGENWSMGIRHAF